MADRTCEKCGQVFKLPCRLKAHLERKVPCVPKPEPPANKPEAPSQETKPTLTCERCHASFTAISSLNRHRIRRSCKAEIATGDSGCVTIEGNQNTVTNSTTVNNTVNNNFNINIAPWVVGKTISVAPETIEEVFQESVPSEWLQYGAATQGDDENGPPHAAAALASFIRKCHADPANQNIYINPNRADQAIVYVGNDVWEIISMNDAIRTLLADAALSAFRVVTSKIGEMVALKLRDTVGVMYMVLLYDPEKCAKHAGASITAHLTNIKNARERRIAGEAPDATLAGDVSAPK
jgi:hypothetical protein